MTRKREQGSATIGIDLGGTNIKAGIVTDSGEILMEKTVDTEAEGGPAHVLERIAGLVKELAASCETGATIERFGIGVPGQVDMASGVVFEAPNLPGWKKIAVYQELEKRIRLRASVDNDANLAALGEYAFGAGKGGGDMLMVTLGTGVGGGLILGGKVFRGTAGGAGEFGHMVIRMDGPLCNCGRRGCVEAFVGTRGILAKVRELLDSGRHSLLSEISEEEWSPRLIGDAAGRGDAVAIEVFRAVGDALGVGIGSVANLLNIERAVVGGGVAYAGDIVLGPAREAAERTSLAVSRNTLQVVAARLGNRAGFIGAARLAMLADSQ